MTPALLLLAIQSVALAWTPSTTPNATSTVYRIPGTCSAALSGGVQVASGLTAASYTDATTVSGTTYCYYITASAPGLGASPPSNTFTAVLPATTPPVTTPPVITPLAPTKVTATAVVVSGLMSRVTVKVVSGTTPATGNVTWSFKGTTVYTTGLNKLGQANEQIPTLLLKFIPLNLQYQGSAKYAPSTGTLP